MSAPQKNKNDLAPIAEETDNSKDSTLLLPNQNTATKKETPGAGKNSVETMRPKAKIGKANKVAPHTREEDQEIEMAAMAAIETTSVSTESGVGSEEERDQFDDETIPDIKKAKKFRNFSELDWTLEQEDTDNYLPCHIMSRCYEATKGLVKVICALILAFLVLAATVISQGTVLFISSQMNLYVGFKRSENRSDIDGTEFQPSCGVPECSTTNVHGNNSLVDSVSCAKVESVRWIWAMFMVQCATYFVTFIRCFWKICFKQKIWPSCGIFFGAMGFETLSTIGMFMLVHMILPQLDVTRGLFLLTAVAFIPSLLTIFNNEPETEELPQRKIIQEETNNTYKRTTFKGLDILACVIQGGALLTWIITMGVKPITFEEEKDEGKKVSEICDYTDKTFNQWQLYFSNDTTEEPFTTTPPRDPPEPPLAYVLPLGQRIPEDVADYWAIPLALLFISFGYWQNFVDRHTSHLGKFGDFLKQFRKDHSKSKTKTNLLLSIYSMILTLALMAIYYVVQFPDENYLEMLFNSEHFYNNPQTCGNAHDDEHIFYSDWLEVASLCIGVGIVCFCAGDIAIQVKLQIASFTIPLVIATPVAYMMFIWACHYNQCDDTWDFGTDYYWNCFSGHDTYDGLLTESYGYLAFFWWISLLWITKYLWFPAIERLAMLDKIFTQPVPSFITLGPSLMMMRRRNDMEVQKPRMQEEKSRESMSRTGARLTDEHVPTMAPHRLGTPFMYMCATMWHETKEEMIQLLTSIFRMNIDQCARYAEKFVYNLEEPDYYEFEMQILFDDAFEAHAENAQNFSVNSYVKDFLVAIKEAANIAYKINVQLNDPVKFVTPYGGRLEWTLPIGKNKLVVHLKDKQKIRNKKRWSQIMYMNYLLGRGIMAQGVERVVRDFVAQNTFILALDGDVDFQPEAVLHLVDLMRRDSKVAAACGRIHPTGSGPMVWYQKFEYSISHWLQKATEHVFGCVLCSPGCFSLFRVSALIDKNNIVKIYSQEAKDPVNYLQYDQGEDRWLCTLLIQHGHRIEYSAAADAFTNAPEDFNEFFNQRRRWITSTFANIIDILKHSMSISRTNESVSMLYMLYQGILFGASILGPATILLLIAGSFELVFGLTPFGAAVLAIFPLIIFMILCYVTKSNTQLFYGMILSVVYAVLQMIVLAGMLRVMVDEGVCASSTIFFFFIVGVFALSALVHPFEITNILHIFIFYLFIPSTYLLLIIYSLCNVNSVSWGTRENKAGKPGQQKKKKGWKKWASYFNLESSNPDDDDDDGCCSMCPCNPMIDARLYRIEQRLDGKAIDKGNKAQSDQASSDTLLDMSQVVKPKEPPKGPWFKDTQLVGNGETKKVSNAEKAFWEILIRDVLSPMSTKQDEQNAIKEMLGKLRNKAVFAFFIIDTLLIVFMLALKMSNEYIGTGIAVNYTCTVNGQTGTFTIDPIGIVFGIVFGSVIVLQVIGMLAHRVFTLMQYIATTVICKSKKGNKEQDQGDISSKEGLRFAKVLQRFDLITEEEEPSSGDEEMGHDDDELLPDDNVAKKKGLKKRVSFSQDKMKEIIEAREEALQMELSKPTPAMERRKSQWNNAARGGRRLSVFQPVVEAMRYRKSVPSLEFQNEVTTRPPALQRESTELTRQKKFVSSILTAKSKPK